MWLAMLFSAILSGVLAALIFGATSRARGFYVTMVSFLLTIVFPSVVVALGDITGGARGFSFGDQSLETSLGFNTLVWLIVLTAVGIVAIIFWLLKTETGRVLAVMAENDDLTQALGIKTFNYKVLAYAISGFFSGLGGALYVNYTGSMSSADLNVFTTILITFIPIIGGTRIYGPFLGTLFVTLVPEFFSSIESYLDIIFGLVFIVVVLGVRGGISGGIANLLDKVSALRRG
jgi:branched-chain amino acid transport system permease protein